uniref:Uncharacterized protein n=1 Tax=Plectus sambesii TaxID=2011161 RepID=A0A914X960_9BILA
MSLAPVVRHGGPIPQDDKDLAGGEGDKQVGFNGEPTEPVPIEGGELPESRQAEPSGIVPGGPESSDISIAAGETDTGSNPSLNPASQLSPGLDSAASGDSGSALPPDVLNQGGNGGSAGESENLEASLSQPKGEDASTSGAFVAQTTSASLLPNQPGLPPFGQPENPTTSETENRTTAVSSSIDSLNAGGQGGQGAPEGQSTLTTDGLSRPPVLGGGSLNETVGANGFVAGPLLTQFPPIGVETSTTGISTAAQTGSGVGDLNSGPIGQAQGAPGDLTLSTSSSQGFNPGQPQPDLTSAASSANISEQDSSTTTSSLTFTEGQLNSTSTSSSETFTTAHLGEIVPNSNSESSQNRSGSDVTTSSEQLPIDLSSAASSTTTSFGFTEVRQNGDSTSAFTSLNNLTDQSSATSASLESTTAGILGFNPQSGSTANNDSSSSSAQQETTTTGSLAFTNDRNQSFEVVNGQLVEVTRSPESGIFSSGAVSTLAAGHDGDNATFGQLTQLPLDGQQPTQAPSFEAPRGPSGIDLNGTTASPFEFPSSTANNLTEASTTGSFGFPGEQPLGGNVNASTDIFTTAGQTTGVTDQNGTLGTTGLSGLLGGQQGETTTTASFAQTEGQLPAEGGITRANTSTSAEETTTGSIFIGGESAFSNHQEQGNSNGSSGTTQSLFGVTDSTPTTAQTNATGGESPTSFPVPDSFPQQPNATIGSNVGGEPSGAGTPLLPGDHTLSPIGVHSNESTTSAGVLVP